MVTILAWAAAGFSLLAALFTLLVFLRLNRRGDDGALAALRLETASQTDRLRAEQAEHARGLRQELGDSIRGFQDSFAARLDSGIDKLAAPVTALGDRLNGHMVRMGGDAAQHRDLLRQALEARLEAADARAALASQALREELTGNFGKTSTLLSENMGVFGDAQHQRLSQMRQDLEALSERHTNAHESLRQSVENRLDALRQENTAKLEEMRQTVDEKLQTALEKRIGESFRTVSEQLERVHAGLGEMATLATGVGDLKRVLSNVKTRGTWGEVQLGNLLEQFLSPDQFLRNAQVKTGSLERVEYAVRFAGRDDDQDVLLPIDAKFPQEDFERLVHAVERADAAAVEDAAAALEARVKSFAKTVSEKYINPPMTTDFAILFLPTESLLAEVLRRPGLFDHLQREYRVTLAGPTTLASMLNAFQMGFRSLAIQKRSSEVWQLLGAVRTEFAQHGKVVDTLKKQLNAATNTIDKLGTRTRAMNRTLKDVELLPSGAPAALIAVPELALDDETDESTQDG